MKVLKYCIIILLLIITPVYANITCRDGTISKSCKDCHTGCCSRHGGCSSGTTKSNKKSSSASKAKKKKSTNKTSGTSSSKSNNKTNNKKNNNQNKKTNTESNVKQDNKSSNEQDTTIDNGIVDNNKEEDETNYAPYIVAAIAGGTAIYGLTNSKDKNKKEQNEETKDYKHHYRKNPRR